MLALAMECLVGPWLVGAAAVAGLVYAAYAYLTSSFDFWLVRGVPYREPRPLLGNFGDLLLFRKSQPEGVLDMYGWFPNERFFGAFRVRSPILYVRDPQIIRHICVKDFHAFSNRGIPVNGGNDPLSAHLFNLEGKKWKNLRSKMSPAFSSGKLKKMFYLLVECSDDLTRIVDGRLADSPAASVVEVRELAANFTIDVIGSCAFGIQMNALSDEHSGFRLAAKKMSEPSRKATLWRMLRTAVPTLYKLLAVQIIDPAVTNFFLKAVSQVIKERENNVLKRHDFMDLMVELKTKGTLELDSGSGLAAQNEDEVDPSAEIVLDDKTIAAQAFAFFVAGFETTSNTIAFCLYELAVNPEIQDKARRDVREAMDKRDGKLTYEAVQDMKYLDMVVLETLRKYPSAPLMSRHCEYPYKLPASDVELPSGVRVIIPIYGIHHDPNHYPEPSVFRPERFDEETKRTRPPCTFLPFGEGPRMCIGMRFALLETKVGVITFLKKYRVEVCEKN